MPTFTPWQPIDRAVPEEATPTVTPFTMPEDDLVPVATPDQLIAEITRIPPIREPLATFTSWTPAEEGPESPEPLLNAQDYIGEPPEIIPVPPPEPSLTDRVVGAGRFAFAQAAGLVGEAGEFLSPSAGQSIQRFALEQERLAKEEFHTGGSKLTEGVHTRLDRIATDVGDLNDRLVQEGVKLGQSAHPDNITGMAHWAFGNLLVEAGGILDLGIFSGTEIGDFGRSLVADSEKLFEQAERNPLLGEATGELIGGVAGTVVAEVSKLAGEIVPDPELGTRLLAFGSEQSQRAKEAFAEAARIREEGEPPLQDIPAITRTQKKMQTIADVVGIATSIMGGSVFGKSALIVKAHQGFQAAMSFAMMSWLDKPGDPEAAVLAARDGFILSYGVDKASAVAKKFTARAKTGLKQMSVRAREELDFLQKKMAGTPGVVRASQKEKALVQKALRESTIPTKGKIVDRLQGVRSNAVVPTSLVNRELPYKLSPGQIRVPEISAALKGQSLEMRKAARAAVIKQSRAVGARTFRIYQETAELRRGIPNDKVAEDMVFFIEKTGNPYIKGDTFEQLSKRLTSGQQSIARRVSFLFERERQNVNKMLKAFTDEEYIKFIENYVPHEWVGKGKVIRDFAKTFSRNSANAKRRIIPTFKEGIEAGLIPRTLDPVRSLEQWVSRNVAVASNIEFYETLKNLKIPVDGVMIPATVGEAGLAKLPKDIAETFVRVQHPLLSKSGKAIFAHPEVADMIKLITPLKKDMLRGTSWLNPERVYRAYDTFNAWTKASSLRFSLFHVQALLESQNAFLATPTHPLRGLLLGLKESRALGFKGRVMPQTAGRQLMRLHPEMVEEAIKRGLILRAPSEAGRGLFVSALENIEARTRGVPFLRDAVKGFRKFNQWADHKLWDNLHQGGKVFAYHDLTQKMLVELPHIPKEKIQAAVAQMVNAGYGGLDWVGMGVSPRAQQFLRRTLLAPDWTFSNILIAGMPLLKFGNPAYRKAGLNYWRNMLGAMTVWTNGLNMVTVGKPAWDNEVGHRGDVDVTSIIQGVKKLLGQEDLNPQTRYYVSGFKQVKELHALFTDPRRFFGAKASPAIQVMTEQLFDISTTGFPMEWRRDQELGGPGINSIPARLTRILSRPVPISLKGNNFAFTFPLRRGMTFFKARSAMAQLIRTDVDDNIFTNAKRQIWYKDGMSEAVNDVLQAAADNGIDGQGALNSARSLVSSFYKGEAYKIMLKSDDAAKAGNLKKLARLNKKYYKLSAQHSKAMLFFRPGYTVGQSIKSLENSLRIRRRRAMGITQ